MKPNLQGLEANNNTTTTATSATSPATAPGPLPPPPLAPNQGLVSSPPGAPTPTAGAGGLAAMMGGGRPGSPPRGLGVLPPTSTTPLLDPITVPESKVNTAFPPFNVSLGVNPRE